MRPTPYLASEDSALLRKAVRGRSGHACLEIGAGNGGNLVPVARAFEVAVGSDLVRPEMADWSEAGAGFVLADLAACFRDGTFDLVMFNPPYLPSDGVEDLAVDAGREAEIPLGFLREALRVVADSGTVVMLLGTDSPVARIQEECERRGFRLARVEEMHLFFEDLVIYEASRAGRTVGRSWR